MITLKPNRKPITLLFFLIFAHTAQAVYFENLSIGEGLSQSTVTSISQDKHGYIWIGTNKGLNRYDGKQFTLFPTIKDHPNSDSVITDDNIFHIISDEQGHLWVSTNQGLNHLNTDTRKVKQYLHKSRDDNSLSSNTTRESLIASNGFLWVVSNGGLDRLDIQANIFKRYRPIDKNGIQICSEFLRTIAEDEHGTLWIGGNEGGLCRFNPKTEEFTGIDYRNDKEKSASIGVRSIYADEHNIIWIATVNGLHKYNTVTGKSLGFLADSKQENSLPDNWVQKVINADSDHVWVSTINGFALLNKKNHKMKVFRKSNINKNSLSSNDTLSLFIDKSGLLWVGTYDSGVDRYNPKQEVFHHISTEGNTGYILSDPSVWSIVKKSGYLWIATSNGLNRYELSTGRIKHYLSDSSNKNSLVDDTIFVITEGKHNDLWLGTRHGISHFQIDTETFTNFQHNTNDPNSLPFNNTIHIFIDNEDNLWMGYYGGGAAIYSLKNKSFRYFSPEQENPNTINSQFVHDIQQLPNNDILIATQNGLSLYNHQSKKFSPVALTFNNKPFSIDHTLIIKIIENGNIAIATVSYLAILNAQLNTVLKIYSKKNGLDDDYIYTVEEDESNNIWVSTNRGISQINLATDMIKNFDILDGLQGYEFNGSASLFDGQYLYFGGFNGLNYFNPSETQINPYIAPVAITSFSKNGNPVENLDFNKTINLSHKDTFFLIGFSVMDFTGVEKNQYAYKLEGFDKNWIYSGNRSFASYTNLDGGDYIFKVKGANKYGLWNEKGTSLALHVEPPPWQKWWAYIIYTFIILLITWLVTQSKILADSKSLSDQIRRMSTSLTQSLNLASIQQQLSQHLKLIFPYQQIKIFLKEKEKFTAGLERTNKENNYFEFSDASEKKILAHISTNKQPLLLTTEKEYKSFKILSIKTEASNLLVLPLITRDTVVGAVILIIPRKFYAFREDRINIAVTLCAQASAAIDNAHLFQKTRQLAFYDALTGLENRRLFRERLELAIKSSERNNSEIAIMFLDLDQFKRINDSLGHDIGDALLVEAANRLKNCVRKNDTVARIGGDEFTILLTNLNGVSGINTVAKKILNSFNEAIQLPRHTINISASIGISIAPRDSVEANSLMKNADAAMYKAKENGRNNFQFFTEEMNIQASKQLQIENDIRQSLNHDEFILQYQPLINLNNYSFTRVEALVRWMHPQKGLLLPEEFIHIAEETGLINSLGNEILDKAFSQAKQFQENHFPPIKIAVNLSARQFIYGSLVKSIKELINKWQISANWLELEITENILVNNIKETVDILSQLKDLGATIAIDDFGTGYSSLSYLKQLPIDTVKIDQSFVKDIPGDLEDAEITSAITAMAHKLSLQVVAEGVEQIEQLNFLKQIKCDFAQGYYFYRPMPADKLMELLNGLNRQKLINAAQWNKNKNQS